MHSTVRCPVENCPQPTHPVVVAILFAGVIRFDKSSFEKTGFSQELQLFRPKS